MRFRTIAELAVPQDEAKFSLCTGYDFLPGSGVPRAAVGVSTDGAGLVTLDTNSHPALVAGSLLFHGKVVRHLVPWVERLAYLSGLPSRLLNPPKRPPEAREELVQIERK